MQRATRIYVCVIAVSKSHEFLLKVRRLSSFFSTTTPTPSRHHHHHHHFLYWELTKRVVIFSTTTQGIRLRWRVDVFSTTSDTSFKPSALLCMLIAASPCSGVDTSTPNPIILIAGGPLCIAQPAQSNATLLDICRLAKKVSHYQIIKISY